ncbi:hypothetical protein K2173_022537 [Erythroxylum novogranatense]|uniref:BZIP domain-containing protein n=1 Tax=Erythroxylum novogranatense TaxID=1862640 RepID=A0AAV8TJS0_9ROSI|nr:hypothetical protein K2173_022537 [Erythroxylum novogranatense]
MTLPNATDHGTVNNYLYSSQDGEEVEATSSSSSRMNKNSNDDNATSLSLMQSKLEESDVEDLFTVPDVEVRPPINSSTVIKNAIESSTNVVNNNSELQSGKRRRGRNPTDKEYRRLKRLLRNRVSAQQARERKKIYVNDLESRAKELQERNSKLEEKISTLTNENTMLRKVLLNTRPKADETTEAKKDQLSKS